MMSDDNNSLSFGATIRCGGVNGLNQPMPSREELLARNSFGGPDQNKYITTAAHRQKMAAKRKREEAIAKKIQKKWGIE